jgi:NAD-dependent dihydropyrimidine dehydrogenase PreA subunit
MIECITFIMAFLLIISALFHSERVKRTYDIKVVNEFSSEFLIEETNNYTIKRFFFFSENFQTTRLYFGNEGGFYRVIDDDNCVLCEHTTNQRLRSILKAREINSKLKNLNP